MAALRCSRCGARIQLDGTTSCSCVPAAADDITYDAFRPRKKFTLSRQAEIGPPPEPALELTAGNGRPRMGRRGKVMAFGVVAAVTLGTAAFSLQAMNSGQEGLGGDRPPLSASTPDVVPPDWLEDSDPPPADGPDDSDPSQPAEGGASHEGGGKDEDSGKHDGMPTPAPHDEDPSPPPSGDTAGGGSQGGGSADGGSTGDPGGNGGGSDGGGGNDQSAGGVLGGLFGGLFGGGDGGNGHHSGHHGNGHDDHNGGNNGNGHHGGDHGGGHGGGGGRH